ncbi:uncharacterized protein LOC114544290 [Dendronephthya gigantea]|uniref:uncharacterized protein LOC114544153 n=1 Tax=Dendronephthya gigantea TaxID=151771 RepID=UPI00106AF50A|nr:uncharacterized protein LOC114544153 [Dendronephthya gigantea]XP_028418761.1 uncharacterized protein LOC114544290 [Dendronephthya gigantea]
MSSSFTDPIDSQSESENNFITSYMMEVEDDAPLATEAQGDQELMQPYQDEPIADTEWVENYYEERRNQDDRLRVLRGRLEGRVSVEGWCGCGNCKTDLLQNEKESKCCQEVEGCGEALSSDIIMQEMSAVPKCITLHPGFSDVCLSIWSLRLAGPKFRRIDRQKYKMGSDENRYLRSVAYRQYIQLVYGYLGKRRIPLPACAYHPLLAPATNKKLSKHPTLLPGEKILLQQDAICVETYLSPVEGTLHLTTFRVIFSGSSPDVEDEAIGGDHHTSLVSKKNSSQFGKKKGFSDTLERFREKAQHFQKNLQHSKSCRTLRSTYKGKSQFTLNRSHENNVVQTSCGENLDDNCKLISLQPVDTPESDETEKDLVQHDIIVSIPCTNVYDIHKLPKNSLVKDPRFFGFGDGIELMCSTLQVYKFCLPQGSDYNADKLAAIFSKYTKHLLRPCFSGNVRQKQCTPSQRKSPSKWFAIAYREAISHTRSCDILYSRTSQNFYDFEVEFRRLGLLTLDCWREYCKRSLSRNYFQPSTFNSLMIYFPCI